MAAQSIPEEPEYISDEFNRGIAAALQRRGIISIPGQQTAAEIREAQHRQKVKDVVAALTPRPPAPDPEPEPVRQSLAQQIKAMIGQPSADQQHSQAPALNSEELLRRAAGG